MRFCAEGVVVFFFGVRGGAGAVGGGGVFVSDVSAMMGWGWRTGSCLGLCGWVWRCYSGWWWFRHCYFCGIFERGGL